MSLNAFHSHEGFRTIKKGAVNFAIGLAFALGFSTVVIARETYIPIISKGFQHQFWQAVKAGAEKAAKDYNVKISFEGPESEAMIDKQIDMLAAALSKKPNAICFAALDSKAALPLLKKIQAAHIPLVAFDSGVDSNIPVTTAATDNRAAAALVADKMAELIGLEGEVAVIANDQTGRSNVDRRDGFVNRIKTAYPKIKIVSIQYSAGDYLKSTEIAKSVLQAHPRLKGFFGANESSAIGVLNGVKEMKRKLVVIGYDSGKQQIDAIRDGSMAGAITQNPVGMGYHAVEAAIQAIKGEKLPDRMNTGFYWYDKSNINDPKISAALYN